MTTLTPLQERSRKLQLPEHVLQFAGPIMAATADMYYGKVSHLPLEVWAPAIYHDLTYVSEISNVVLPDGSGAPPIVRGHFMIEQIWQEQLVPKDLEQMGIPFGPQSCSDEPVLMIIGKAPGYEEASRLGNFVGPIGKDALALLESEGLIDCFKHVYLCNLVRWHRKAATDSLLRKYALECLPILYHELVTLQPVTIVYFGSAGLCSLFNKLGHLTTTRRGDVSIFAMPLDSDRSLISAFLQLPFDVKTSSRAAVRRLRSLLVEENEHEPHKDSQYEVCTTLREFTQKVDQWLQEGVKSVVIDTEWHGRFGNRDSFLRCMQFYTGSGRPVILPFTDENGNTLIDAFDASPEINRLFDGMETIVGSFIYSDAVWLKWIGCDMQKFYERTVATEGRQGVFDVAIAASVLDETLRLDLCELAKVYLNAQPWDGEILAWMKENGSDVSVGTAPARLLYDYAAKDVYYTYGIYKLLHSSDMRDNNRVHCWRAYVNATQMCSVLVEMMSCGIGFSKKLAEDKRNLLKTVKEKLLEDIRQALNWPTFDPQKTRHLIAALFNEGYLNGVRVMPEGAKSLNLTPIKPTSKAFRTWDEIPAHLRPSMTPCVDKEVCGILAGRHPIAAKIRDLGFINQTLKTVLGPQGLDYFVCDDNRIRSFFAPTTESGRCRSSRPNVQNLSNRRDADYTRICGTPVRLRDMLVADEGYVLLDCDFVSAELFLLGVMAGDSLLIEHCLRAALPDDDPDYHDVHSSIAVQAFGLKCPPTKQGLKSIGKEHLRVCSKSIIYGLSYGRGDAAICAQIRSEGTNVTLDEVRTIKDSIFRTYSKLPPLFEKLRCSVRDPGYQVNYFGRCRRFVQSYSSEIMAAQEREALNFPFQSMTASCLNILAYNLQTSPARQKIDFRLLAPVHDALWVECRKEDVDDFAELIRHEATKVKFRQWNVKGIAIGHTEFYIPINVKVKE